MPTLTTVIQVEIFEVLVLEVLAIGIGWKKKRKEIYPDWKRRGRTVTADDMIFYVEKPKDSTQNLLNLINKYSKVARYNINIQK